MSHLHILYHSRWIQGEYNLGHNNHVQLSNKRKQNKNRLEKLCFVSLLSLYFRVLLIELIACCELLQNLIGPWVFNCWNTDLGRERNVRSLCWENQSVCPRTCDTSFTSGCRMNRLPAATLPGRGVSHMNQCLGSLVGRNTACFSSQTVITVDLIEYQLLSLCPVGKRVCLTRCVYFIHCLRAVWLSWELQATESELKMLNKNSAFTKKA